MLKQHIKNLCVLPDRIIYFAKLFFFTAGLHAVVLISFLLLYSSGSIKRMHVVAASNKHDVKIVVVPMMKTIPGALQKVANAQTQKKTVVKKNELVKVAKKQETKIHKPQAPKKVVPAVVQKAVPKKVVKKEEPKKVLKKLPEKKIEPPKQKKEEKPKIAEKKVEAAVQKSEPVKKVEKPEQKSTKNETKKVPVQQPSQEMKKENIVEKSLQEDEVIFVGRDDALALSRYQDIQKRITEVWHAPVGVAKDATCTVRIVLNSDGSKKDVVVSESSNVLIYDIAARMALERIDFPKQSWGSEVMVTFKQ